MNRRPWSKLNPNGWELANGQFDPTNHEAELWLYRGAQNRGATMLYFWNGPPYGLTVSGCSSGSLDSTSNNLPAGQEARFAKHIVDVLAFFRETYGLRADLICPINEPECDWWRGGDQGGQRAAIPVSGECAQRDSLKLGENSRPRAELRLEATHRVGVPRSRGSDHPASAGLDHVVRQHRRERHTRSLRLSLTRMRPCGATPP